MVVRVHERPQVGAWYQDQDHPEVRFEIVAQDEEDQALELQYFDGEIEEVDYDTWYHNMHVQPINPPKDWSGPFDDIEPEDLREMRSEIILPTYWGGFQPLEDRERYE